MGLSVILVFFFLQWKQHGLWNQIEMVRDSCHILDRLHGLFVRIEIPAFKVVLRVKGDDDYEATHSELPPVWSLTHRKH